MMLPIAQITADPNQPRKVFDDQYLLGLAQSLKTEGMINAIEVDENNTIITGECRYKAAQLAGWEEVPVVVTVGLDQYQRLRRQMAENLHQGKGLGMNAIDIAEGFARLLEFQGHNWRNISNRHQPTLVQLSLEIGISAETILEYLLLLHRPSYVIEDIRQGRARTFYRDIETLPAKIQHFLSKKIANGEYQSREDVRIEKSIIHYFPELTASQMERRRNEESPEYNQLLNKIAVFALALDRLSLAKVPLKQQGLLINRLKWLESQIEDYLGGGDSIEETR